MGFILDFGFLPPCPLPPAPLFLPLSNAKKHTVFDSFRLLKGSEGATHRCAVSNVERMHRAFDFYVQWPGR